MRLYALRESRAPQSHSGTGKASRGQRGAEDSGSRDGHQGQAGSATHGMGHPSCWIGPGAAREETLSHDQAEGETNNELQRESAQPFPEAVTRHCERH